MDPEFISGLVLGAAAGVVLMKVLARPYEVAMLAYENSAKKYEAALEKARKSNERCAGEYGARTAELERDYCSRKEELERAYESKKSEARRLIKDAREAYELRERASAKKEEKLDALISAQEAATSALRVAEERTRASEEANKCSKAAYDHARELLRISSPTELVEVYDRNCELQAQVAFVREDRARLGAVLDNIRKGSDN